MLGLLQSCYEEGARGRLGSCLAVERLTPLYLAELKIQQGDLAGGSDRGRKWGCSGWKRHNYSADFKTCRL